MKVSPGSSLGRRPRRRFTLEQIQNYLRAFDRSGMSVAAFAGRHDLGYSVLSRWIQRRAQAPGTWAGTGRRRGQRPKLREVPLSSLLGPGRWAAEIVRPDGVTVRVAHDVPAAWLDSLLFPSAC